MSIQIIITILLAAGSLAYFIPTPQELREAFTAGQNYFAARNYPKAIAQYDKVLETESDLLTADSVRVTLLNGDLTVGVRSAALYQKGNAYRILGGLDSSIATFRAALERPDSPRLLVLSRYQIYDLFLQKKEYDSAITEARQLIRLHPFDEKVEQAHYDIGWAFRFKDQYDSSSASFRFLAERYPESPFRVRALYQIGQNALDAQRWTDAIAAFRRLAAEYTPEKFSKTDFESMELRANRERQIFEAASNRESDNTNLELVSKGEFKVAEAFEHLNEVDSAVGRYQYIIRTYTLLPSLVEISYIRWAELLQRVQGTENAVAVYRRAIDEQFQDKVFQARMQYKIARTYQDQKEFRKAAAEYAFFVKAYAEHADASNFPLENARFFSLLNSSAAKDHPAVIAAADSFLAYHDGSEFVPKALVMRGNARLAQREFDAARDDYRQVMDRFPMSEESDHARMQTARTFYDEKNFAEAVRAYQDLESSLTGETELSEVRYFLGMSQFNAGALDDAAASLRQVAPSSPFYPYAFGRTVKILSSQGKTDEASTYISGILAALPDSSEHRAYAHLAYGELLTAQGKFPEAIREMTVVLNDESVVPNARLQARFSRGSLYQQTKRYKEAIVDLELLLSQEAFRTTFATSVPMANERLAMAYLGVGKRREAVERLVTLKDQAPTKAERVRYLSAITELYVQLNDFANVVQYGTQVVRADSADELSRAKAYAALANAYGNLNRIDDVVTTLMEAADTMPKHPYIRDVYWETSTLMFDGGAFAPAEKLFQKFITRYPDDARTEKALANRGTALFGIGKVDEAVAVKRQYLQKYPTSTDVPKMQYEIAEIFYNAERFDMAIQEYERTAKLYPSSEYATTALYNTGWCHYRLGDTVRMVQSFERFAKSYPAAPQAPDAYFSIGDFYYNAKEYEKAKGAYQYILDKYPAYPRYEEAKALVRELNQINSYTEYAKAMNYFDTQDFARAIPMLQEVLKKYPDADIRFACEANIASAYSELGDRKKAKELFAAIIEKYASVPEAQMVVFFAEQHKRWLESDKHQ